MTDREIPAQAAQISPKVLPRYVKKTMKQVANGPANAAPCEPAKRPAWQAPEAPRPERRLNVSWKAADFFQPAEHREIR